MSAQASESQDRHAEIWATRVQRELLALTTTEQALLPPFVGIQKHELDIANATCTIDFQVQILTTTETKTTMVQLDVSLPKNSDGSLRNTSLSYPFSEPSARLLQGQEFFAKGSTIQNGDLIAIDIEWTPSLHLVSSLFVCGCVTNYIVLLLWFLGAAHSLSCCVLRLKTDCILFLYFLHIYRPTQ
jgi:hypothetical protein